MHHNWKETKIWKKLENIDSEVADSVRTFLNNKDIMPSVESILFSGGTSQKDFTLHDADHSFRVAERMWDIIPTTTQEILSEYELAMLLLSAYLHDIGMTPEYGKIKSHLDFLITDQKDLLNKKEKKDLQNWLDETGEILDIEKEKIQIREKAEELIFYYSRHKHNDWSEEWIKNNFKSKQLAGYTNWINDLVIICRSHHYGLDELRKKDFSPITIENSVIHKRYIAMCLRLADVIEIDPERAPEVLLKHRQIINESISHWLKEKFTSIQISNGCITVTATPDKAFIHKAILDVCEQIEHETQLCNSLKIELPLSNIFPHNNLKHEWNISPTIYRQITEDGSYEYIDGTFRPNSKKLLELLAGSELYGNPMLAVRELIQNSLDAIKVQIGYKILEDKVKGNDKDEIERIKQKFNLNLKVYEKDGEYWLSCKDNGAGMDKEIIKKCFLVGGAAKRRELIELERECKKIGYNLELTGKFGIGVLSYFMIADKIIVKTQMSIQAGNSDKTGYEFEINNLSDFGELRKIDLENNGTEIKLKIKGEFVKKIIADKSGINTLDDFVNKTLTRVPCNFLYISFEKKEIKFTPGWCKTKDYFKIRVIDEFMNSISDEERKINSDFVTLEQKEEISFFIKQYSEREKPFSDSIKFLVTEGKLENSLGYYRIHIPYFKNLKGFSFVYLFEKEAGKEELEKISESIGFKLQDGIELTSWKGIDVNVNFNSVDDIDYDNSRYRFPQLFIEIDLIEENYVKLEISRNTVLINNKRFIIDQLYKIVFGLIDLNKSIFDNTYNALNFSVCEVINFNQNNFYWFFDNINGSAFFQKIEIKNELLISNYYSNNFFLINTLLRSIDNIDLTSESLSFPISDFQPFRIAFRYINHVPYLIRIYYNELMPSKDGTMESYEFPNSWYKLLAFVDPSNNIILNNQCFEHKEVQSKDLEFAKNFIVNNLKLDSSEASEILSCDKKAFCFIINILSSDRGNKIAAIFQNNKPFWERLWSISFNNSNDEFYFYNSHDKFLITFSRGVVNRIVDNVEILKYLPIPGDEWLIKRREDDIN